VNHSRCQKDICANVAGTWNQNARSMNPNKRSPREEASRYCCWVTASSNHRTNLSFRLPVLVKPLHKSTLIRIELMPGYVCMHPADELQRGTTSEPAAVFVAARNDFPSCSVSNRKHLKAPRSTYSITVWNVNQLTLSCLPGTRNKLSRACEVIAVLHERGICCVWVTFFTQQFAGLVRLSLRKPRH
jgi:hypothetical protein